MCNINGLALALNCLRLAAVQNLCRAIAAGVRPGFAVLNYLTLTLNGLVLLGVLGQQVGKVNTAPLCCTFFGVAASGWRGTP